MAKGRQRNKQNKNSHRESNNSSGSSSSSSNNNNKLVDTLAAEIHSSSVANQSHNNNNNSGIDYYDKNNHGLTKKQLKKKYSELSDRDIHQLVELLIEKRRLEESLRKSKKEFHALQKSTFMNNNNNNNKKKKKQTQGIITTTTSTTTTTTTTSSSSSSIKNSSLLKHKEELERQFPRYISILLASIMSLLLGFLIGSGTIGNDKIISNEWRDLYGRQIRSCHLFTLWTGSVYRYYHYPIASSLTTTSLTTTTTDIDTLHPFPNNNDDVPSASPGQRPQISSKQQIPSSSSSSNSSKVQHYVMKRKIKWSWSWLLSPTSFDIFDNSPANPSHDSIAMYPTLMFDLLKESILREEGGYIHPDLGLLQPAPSGANRGIGMIRDTYNSCQVHCNGNINKRYKTTTTTCHTCRRQDDDMTHILPNNNNSNSNSNSPYKQEEVLLRIPLEIQLTRYVALSTLGPLLPAEVRRQNPLESLDDAALLVLLLAYERTRGIASPYFAYIASLPQYPSCGYNHDAIPENYNYDIHNGYNQQHHQHFQENNMMNNNNNNNNGNHNTDTTSRSTMKHKNANRNLKTEIIEERVQALGDELGLDVSGWIVEIQKASNYAFLVTDGLATDYGPYLLNSLFSNTDSMHENHLKAVSSLSWALCQVSSRATAGNKEYGSLRLVPLLDLINHDRHAGGFVELQLLKDNHHTTKFGTTTIQEHAGTFVVRSLRHGRHNPLKVGQELLVNYNVPNYSPFDWFLNLGFVPPERWGRWTKVEAALPRLDPQHNSRTSS